MGSSMSDLISLTPENVDKELSDLPRLVRLAFGLTGDRWLAEDLAQTALVILGRKQRQCAPFRRERDERAANGGHIAQLVQRHVAAIRHLANHANCIPTAERDPYQHAGKRRGRQVVSIVEKRRQRMVQRDPDKDAQLTHPPQAALAQSFHLNIGLCGA